MSPGKVDGSVVARHLAALDAAIQQLARPRERPLSVLEQDPVLNQRLPEFETFARHVASSLEES